MTDKEFVDSEELDKKATLWVNEVAPKIYEALEKAEISYDDEMVCLLLSDGFMAGYRACMKEIKAKE